jgi:hypothetical protein
VVEHVAYNESLTVARIRHSKEHATMQTMVSIWSASELIRKANRT